MPNMMHIEDCRMMNHGTRNTALFFERYAHDAGVKPWRKGGSARILANKSSAQTDRHLKTGNSGDTPERRGYYTRNQGRKGRNINISPYPIDRVSIPYG